MLSIRSDTSIREAVKLLAKHNFSCAPVVDVTKLGAKGLKWQDKYLGLLILSSFDIKIIPLYAGVVDTVGLVMYMLDFLGSEAVDFDAESALVASFDQNTVADMTSLHDIKS